MRKLLALCLLLAVPGHMWAQADAQKTDSSAGNWDVAAELKALREALLETQKQMAAQQREIETLMEQAKAGRAALVGNEQPPGVIDAAMHTAIPSSPGSAGSPILVNAGPQPA